MYRVLVLTIYSVCTPPAHCHYHAPPPPRRWAKLRASVVPVCMILEPISECLFLSLMIAWSCAILFTWSPVVVIAVHCLIWFILDYILIRTIQVCSHWSVSPRHPRPYYYYYIITSTPHP